MTLTLQTLSQRTRQRLVEFQSGELDARLLIEHFANLSRSDFILRPDMEISKDAQIAISAAIARRLAGEPVYRIIGEREFYGLPLKLSKDTLEPRPDTETLVDAVLPFVKQRIGQTGLCRIIDLGAGTGAIALALLAQAREATALGIDISADALATAQANAVANGLADRYRTQLSSWLEAVEGEFDLIVSNPPYIRSDVVPTLSREVREHDPLAALDGGPEGLAPYRIIAESAGAFLADSGLIGVEIGYDQRAAVAAIFEACGFAVDGFFRDLGQNNRVIVFHRA